MTTSHPVLYITEVLHELSTEELCNLSRELRKIMNSEAPALEPVSKLLLRLLSINNKPTAWASRMDNLSDVRTMLHFEIIRRFETYGNL